MVQIGLRGRDKGFYVFQPQVVQTEQFIWYGLSQFFFIKARHHCTFVISDIITHLCNN